LVGSLGPKGFATDLVGAGDAFTTVHWRTLATETALYHADLQNRSVKQIFSTDPQDMILAVQEVGRERNAWDYTLVLTRQFVRLLTPEGVEVFKAPFEPGYPDCRQVELSLLEPNGRFALWMEPYYLVNEKAGWKLPTHVTWYDGGRKTASVELPPIPRSYEVSFSEEKVESLLLPPVLIAALPGFMHGDRMAREWRIWLFISLAFSVVVCLPVGYWLTRRNALPRSAQLGWSVFLLLFGFPGLLALLSVEEWPARAPCPNCKKRRVVSREHCEHCGAKFSPPEKRGIEIFDAAGA